MNAQEIFDTAYKHLLTQNKQAVSRGICRYLTSEGLSCAAGCLLTPEEARKFDGLSDSSWRYIASHGLAPERLKGHEGLIRILQYVHDEKPVSDWQLSLKSIAEDANLTIPR